MLGIEVLNFQASRSNTAKIIYVILCLGKWRIRTREILGSWCRL